MTPMCWFIGYSVFLVLCGMEHTKDLSLSSLKESLRLNMLDLEDRL